MVIRTGRTLRDTISILSPRIIPQRGHCRPSFEIRVNSRTVLIFAGNIELIFGGTYALYGLPFSPKLTVYCSVLQKDSLEGIRPAFHGGSREIIYSPSLCCDSYVPTANSKLLIS